MTSLKQITLDLLDSIGRRPQKRLGQNFLIDPTILGRIVDAAEIRPEDTVVEIGTGLGVLTKELADRAAKVITIEIDSELLNLSKEILARYQNIEFIRGDLLKIDYARIMRDICRPTEGKFPATRNAVTSNYKIVANLPYYITAPIVEKIFGTTPPPQLVVLTVQKEVAERMAAHPGKKTYGSFSVFCQFHGKIELVSLVPKFAFFPQPEVSSAIVKITPHKKLLLSSAEKDKFFAVVHAAFQQRRKMLSSSLKKFNIKDWPVNPQRRPETLAIEEFIRLCQAAML
jgi:16S rRNA (adenine1518-N6/adenine1519-N6)-dimethyltransferase